MPSRYCFTGYTGFVEEESFGERVRRGKEYGVCVGDCMMGSEDSVLPYFTKLTCIASVLNYMIFRLF
jgi:hypothetical protein